MRIVVTEEDIRLGEKHMVRRCPIARAIKRTVPKGKLVEVEKATVRIGTFVYRLTGRLIRFVSQFDSLHGRRLVKPGQYNVPLTYGKEAA